MLCAQFLTPATPSTPPPTPIPFCRGVYVSFPAGSWTNGIDNPAPFIFENGTTLLFFRSETCPKNWGALAPACIGVARADTWQGPYESLFVDPITHPEGEDPAVFRDPRGNFHMLTCVFACSIASTGCALRLTPSPSQFTAPATSTRTTCGARKAWRAGGTRGPSTGLHGRINP